MPHICVCVCILDSRFCCRHRYHFVHFILHTIQLGLSFILFKVLDFLLEHFFLTTCLYLVNLFVVCQHHSSLLSAHWQYMQNMNRSTISKRRSCMSVIFWLTHWCCCVSIWSSSWLMAKTCVLRLICTGPTQPVAHRLCCLWYSVMLPAETFKMRNCLLTLSLSKLRQNTEATFKTHELFI